MKEIQSPNVLNKAYNKTMSTPIMLKKYHPSAWELGGKTNEPIVSVNVNTCDVE